MARRAAGRTRTDVGIDDADELDGLDDLELSRQAGHGEAKAAEELFRRHGQAAWRLAQAVVNDPSDAVDAVAEGFVRASKAAGPATPYRTHLLAATRHAGIAIVRHGSAPARRDASIERGADTIFRSLPERWRSVLWLTEVEALPAPEAGAILGLSPTAAAQLADRARAGFRARIGGDVAELGPALRRLGSATPAPLASVVVSWQAFQAEEAVPATTHRTRFGLRYPVVIERAAAGVAAAVLTLGVVTSGMFGRGAGGTEDPTFAATSPLAGDDGEVRPRPPGDLGALHAEGADDGSGNSNGGISPQAMYSLTPSGWSSQPLVRTAATATARTGAKGTTSAAANTSVSTSASASGSQASAGQTAGAGGAGSTQGSPVTTAPTAPPTTTAPTSPPTTAPPATPPTTTAPPPPPTTAPPTTAPPENNVAVGVPGLPIGVSVGDCTGIKIGGIVIGCTP